MQAWSSRRLESKTPMPHMTTIRDTGWIAVCASLLLAAGCATPPSLGTGDQFVLHGQHLDAARAYKNALHEPGSKGVRSEIERKLTAARTAVSDRSVADAEQAFEGLDPVTVPGLEKIIASLQTVVEWDDRRGKVAGKIADYEGRLEQLKADARRLYDSAVAEAGACRFGGALDAIGQARRISPDDEAFRRGEAGIRGQKSVYERVVTHLDHGDVEKAAEEFSALARLTGRGDNLFDSPLRDRAVPLASKMVAAMTRQKKWSQALEYLARWKSAGLAEMRADVKRQAAEDYCQRARLAMEKNGEFHKAYLFTLWAAALDPENAGIFVLHRQAKDRVNESLQRHVALAAFDSPTDDPDAGNQFSDALAGYLYQALPYGINIVEREKIDDLVKELQNRHKQIPDLLEADLMVSGRVSLFKVDTITDERTATAKIIVNEQPVENPEFLQMLRLHGADTSTWPKVPPRMLTKEEVQLVKYRKGVGRKKGFAKVSVRILDAHKGTVTFVKDYDASVVETSEFQDEVADAGIRYIPMSLPTDTEMKEAMRKEIVAQVAEVVRAAFEKREIRLLNQARLHLQRREREAALKPLAEGHLYCIQSGIGDDNKTRAEIGSLIDALAE